MVPKPEDDGEMRISKRRVVRVVRSALHGTDNINVNERTTSPAKPVLTPRETLSSITNQAVLVLSNAARLTTISRQSLKAESRMDLKSPL